MTSSFLEYEEMRDKKGRFVNGHVSWLKGKHHTKESKRKMSLAHTKKISLEPTKDLGYLCGLIIGDGWLFHTKTNNYRISLESSDNQLIQQFTSIVNKVFPNLNILIYTRQKLRKFGKRKYNSPTTVVVINSKALYEALRPYKQKDYYWEIPEFLTTKESIIGFLQGIYDAEGSVSRRNKKTVHSIVLSSKHKSNLSQVQNILSKFGVVSSLYQHSKHKSWELSIYSKENMKQFKRIIGFKLNRKAILLNHLPRMKCNRVTEEDKRKMRMMRREGHTYKEIARTTGFCAATVAYHLDSEFRQRRLEHNKLKGRAY